MVVAHGVNNFLPSPPNYVTRSPGPERTPQVQCMELLHVRLQT